MITRLDWDTNFFGLGIARIECKAMEESQFSFVIDQLKKEGIKLVYCICYDLTSERYARKIGQLVDNKVVYHKLFNFDILSTTQNNIEEYIDEEPTEELYNLAIQSGVWSRFNVDPILSNDKFVELYRAWIRNSTQKQIAFKVLVAKESGNVVGLITLGEKEGRADIGLLAVDSKYHGKGIGKSLVNGAEREFKKRFKEGQVVTQKDNVAACALYESCGYTVEKTEPIYHIWL